jgi:ABC-2 type transport system ATP-binding protein
MVHDPPILILDEPTAGLDPMQIQETLSLIKQMSQSHTILFSTHILPEVEAICERVIIIKRGRIDLDRKLSELEVDPGILVEVRGPAEQVLGVLRTTDGVVRVTSQSQEDGWTAFEIETTGARDLRETVCQRIVKNGWTMRKLDQRRRRLVERFMASVMDRTSAAGLAPTAAPPFANPESATHVTANPPAR